LVTVTDVPERPPTSEYTDPEDGDSKPSEMSAIIYQQTWHHIPKDINLHQHCCENVKPCIITLDFRKKPLMPKNHIMYHHEHKIFI